eukprot:5025630-Pyramimonas_sp.AAC.1
MVSGPVAAMRDAQTKLEPNVISYNAGISACEKGGQRRKALSLLGEMWGAMCELDVASYIAGISACARGEWDVRSGCGAQRCQLRRWNQSVSGKRGMAASPVATRLYAGSKVGARRHQLLRWDQRLREAWTLAAGP